MSANDGIVMLGPDEAKELLEVFGGQKIAIRADGEDTRGAYALLQMAASGNFAPPPAHIHHQEEEGWFILEGSLQFQIGERTTLAGPGSFVLAPRGSVHSFSNPSSDPVRWLTIFSPSGMEGYFREMAHRGHIYQAASMDEIQAVARRFNFEFV
jgi:mannose-6-phosphate isomerase-like protein (cupin superfamily)